MRSTASRSRIEVGRDVARVKAGMVILDPLAELIEGEENSANEMRPIIPAIRRKNATAHEGRRHSFSEALRGLYPIYRLSCLPYTQAVSRSEVPRLDL
jgi:hypothetical protein